MAALLQHPSQGRHGRAAYADQMNVFWMICHDVIWLRAARYGS
jgi:hypothetical protein